MCLAFDLGKWTAVWLTDVWMKSWIVIWRKWWITFFTIYLKVLFPSLKMYLRQTECTLQSCSSASKIHFWIKNTSLSCMQRHEVIYIASAILCKIEGSEWGVHNHCIQRCILAFLETGGKRTQAPEPPSSREVISVLPPIDLTSKPSQSLLHFGDSVG